MTRTEVKYDDSALRKELDRLLRSGRDLEPAMPLATSPASPSPSSGRPPRTARRGRRCRRSRRDSGKANSRTGRTEDLALRILSGWDSAAAGSNLAYAAAPQFSVSKGVFGTTSRGAPVPRGDISARPFLSVRPEQEELIRRIVGRRTRAANRALPRRLAALGGPADGAEPWRGTGAAALDERRPRPSSSERICTANCPGRCFRGAT